MSSYELTVPISATLKGANTGHKIYKLSLTPVATGTKTPFRIHWESALTVEILSVEGTVAVIRGHQDKTAGFAAAAIVGDGNTITTVHGLAVYSAPATEGAPARFSLEKAVGVRRVIKGVADVGDSPALHIGVANSYDASTHDVAMVTAMMRVRFTGTSDSIAYAAGLPNFS